MFNIPTRPLTFCVNNPIVLIIRFPNKRFLLNTLYIQYYWSISEKNKNPLAEWHNIILCKRNSTARTINLYLYAFNKLQLIVYYVYR